MCGACLEARSNRREQPGALEVVGGGERLLGQGGSAAQATEARNEAAIALASLIAVANEAQRSWIVAAMPQALTMRAERRLEARRLHGLIGPVHGREPVEKTLPSAARVYSSRNAQASIRNTLARVRPRTGCPPADGCPLQTTIHKLRATMG